MRCDRQMFPPRQLLRSAFGRGERRGCISDLKKRKKRRETGGKKTRKTSLPPHPASARARSFFCRRVFEGMPSHVGIVHPHPTRMNAVLISLGLIELPITRTSLRVIGSYDTLIRMKLKLIASSR